MLDDLKTRRVQTVDLWITDGHQAMLNALALKFPTSRRQRGVKHKLEPVLSYLPQSNREPLEPELKAIFYQDSRAQAEQTLAAFIETYATTSPSAIECLKRDQAACLTCSEFPEGALEDDPHHQCHRAPVPQMSRNAATKWPLPFALRPVACCSSMPSCAP
ncbi:MAG TPA: hypothetical protein DEP84_19695 [Chloroflexi bacterium]|nr:hypothetical protein [Chloroflexota bacterium]